MQLLYENYSKLERNGRRRLPGETSGDRSQAQRPTVAVLGAGFPRLSGLVDLDGGTYFGYYLTKAETQINLKKENDTLDGINEVEARNRQAVQAGFDTWKDGRGSIYDLLAPEAKWTIAGNSPAARTYESRQDFIDNVIKPFNARLSSRLVPAVRGVYTDRDMVIVLWDGLATARDGKPYRNSYAWFLQMQEGQIVEATAFFDSMAFTDFWTRVKPAEG